MQFLFLENFITDGKVFCVFQNVLNWELKENSFCIYTGDREKETLKNRTF